MQTRQPFKVFESQGHYFLYHTSSGQLFHIEADVAQFLELCYTLNIEDARQHLIKNGTTESLTNAIVSDVTELANQGLFTVYTQGVSTDVFEKELEKRYSAPWNKLELALAESCNLACKYCYCSNSRDIPNQGLMSENIARHAITWLFAMSGKSESVSITFFGGEPLLNKSVLRFAIKYSQQLAALHEKKVYYSMTTNGTLLDDEVIHYIKRYNFGLMVSLDGPEELHNSQCPTQTGEGSFNIATKGIKALMKRRRSVTVRCTMTHPVPNILNLIQFFEDFGFTRIVLGRTVNPIHQSPVDFQAEDFAEMRRQEINEVIPWILEKLARGETPKYYPYSKFIKDYENGVPAPPNLFRCGACRGTTTVGADGNLYPCHRFVGMQNWKIGDIQTGPDYEKCKQFWRNYRKSISGQCDSCWLWRSCGGPCPWEIAQADGNFNMKLKYCDDIEEHFKLASYIFVKKQEQTTRKGKKNG